VCVILDLIGYIHLRLLILLATCVQISVLMPNGRFEQHLLTRRDGLWQPIALCIDMKGQLIVTEGLGKVKIYKYI